mmetsp:Transcript_24045/g.55794  ORF Transcript_24045/g.55794 Transcript_24045/m.55794 type:complete len:333 (-) Transcript_24045:465-1463(-)|eukprot:CAMPEP_0119353600 /NCGR_PEP_ID=MMETSP1334-20130426/2713_1 /TAXON_ID=127549 /ORGANISM="Calcidiscus leptoporus, Strain RCC1130" /LENGTH=332 /DNA_ID=CAMNT_0007366915 /DNA_START=117 /DNA_END=1115 /DNA_ORIENTATION=+
MGATQSADRGEGADWGRHELDPLSRGGAGQGGSQPRSAERSVLPPAQQAAVDEFKVKHGEWALHKAMAADEWKADVQKISALIDTDPDALSRKAKARKSTPRSSWRLLLSGQRARPSPSSLSRTDGAGLLPLHLAARFHASEDVVALLIERYPDGAKAPNQDGALPLHWAVAYLAPNAVVAMLLEQHPNGAKLRDAFGFLPLHLAAINEASPEVVALLCETCPEQMQHLCGDDKDYAERMYHQGLPMAFALLTHYHIERASHNPPTSRAVERARAARREESSLQLSAEPLSTLRASSQSSVGSLNSATLSGTTVSIDSSVSTRGAVRRGAAH